MTWGAVAIAGATVVSGVMSSDSQSRSADKAARSQERSAAMGVEEQRRQFDAITELMSPYVGAGESALERQKALAGVSGAGAQQQAIDSISQSPQLQALMKQGEEGILQSASATGGLRGGNVQGALAQFRPGMLQQAIEQQYRQLGGLTQLGQASAGRQAAAGQTMAGQVSGLYQQQGAAAAGAHLARGQAQADLYGNVLDAGIGLYKAGVF